MVNRYPQQNVGIQHINCSLCFTGFFGQFLVVLKKIGGTKGRSCTYLQSELYSKLNCMNMQKCPIYLLNETQKWKIITIHFT